MTTKSVEEFFVTANNIGNSPGLLDYVLAEPIPEWLNNVALRFTRTCCPSLKLEDVKTNPARFHGLCAGIFFSLGKMAEETEIPDLPDNPLAGEIRKQFDLMKQSEMPAIREAVSEAHTLPHDVACEFFASFAKGASGEAVCYSLERMGDNHTVQICLFLMSVRPWIDAKKVRNIAELLTCYRKILRACGDKFFDENPRAWANFSAQFRNICSEDGLRIANRGRPRKNTSDKPSTA